MGKGGVSERNRQSAAAHPTQGRGKKQMNKLLSFLGVLIGLWALVSCGPAPAPTAAALLPTDVALPTATATAALPSTPLATATPLPSPTPTPALPPVEGPEPSPRIAAFYYPWYGSPQVDGEWIHWDEGGFRPPQDLSSDYYPQMGAYSSRDPVVVARHFAWLRQAGVGVIVTSWWGRRSHEERVVPLLLEMGERYGIQVAFHLEPYGGRSASQLVDDIRYLYQRYGASPAFFRSTAATRWSPDDRRKGLFFLWAARFPSSEEPAIEAPYWREAMDAIHALPDGGLVLADETISEWVDGGHFDGLYSYAVLEPGGAEAYAWAGTLPPDAWYVPGVNPGFSAVRIGYEKDTYVPRRDGAAYEERWQAALGTGVEPALVAITTFNEWHEGTQIEPAAAGVDNGRGHTYDDYGALPPEGYLALTRQWVERFAATSWPESRRLRFRVVTSSDWTTFGLVEGAAWLRPSLVSASAEADYAGPDGARFALNQPLARAEAGKSVEMVVDILITGAAESAEIVFEIERGHVGSTTVELAGSSGAESRAAVALVWDGIATGERNARRFEIPVSRLFGGP